MESVVHNGLSQFDALLWEVVPNGSSLCFSRSFPPSYWIRYDSQSLSYVRCPDGQRLWRWSFVRTAGRASSVDFSEYSGEWPRLSTNRTALLVVVTVSNEMNFITFMKQLVKTFRVDYRIVSSWMDPECPFPEVQAGQALEIDIAISDDGLSVRTLRMKYS